MTRIFALAAAAALIAAPASAQSAKVALTGKSNTEIQADIAKAAKKVCNQATVGASFPQQMFESCFKYAVTQANAKLSSQMAAAGQTAASAN
jgi:hypothetical protein